jgi:RimJ/RimL family protein N-acetyltransferase
LPTLPEEEFFIQSLDGKVGLMLIAVEEQNVIGCLTAEVATHPQLCHSCEIGIGVLKKRRGIGIGTALMTRLAQWAKRTGLRRIQASVFARNEPAILFYQRLGYLIEGNRKEAVKIGKHYEDILDMAKRISRPPIQQSRLL